MHAFFIERNGADGSSSIDTTRQHGDPGRLKPTRFVAVDWLIKHEHEMPRNSENFDCRSRDI